MSVRSPAVSRNVNSLVSIELAFTLIILREKRPENESVIRILPLEIVCGGCGKVLYTGFDLKSPKDVIRTSENKCSACGKSLSPSDFTIEIVKV